MKYRFTINDEKTLSNNTVKVTVRLTGPANAMRPELERRIRDTLSTFIEDANWVFGGFTINRNQGVPLFTATTSARIPVSGNDDLVGRAQDSSTDEVFLQIVNVDDSIPLHLVREGQEEIRLNLFAKVQEEVIRLKEKTGIDFEISKVDYRADMTAADFLAGRGKDKSFSNSYAADSAAGAISYSEKIYGQADVTLKS